MESNQLTKSHLDDPEESRRAVHRRNSASKPRKRFTVFYLTLGHIPEFTEAQALLTERDKHVSFFHTWRSVFSDRTGCVGHFKTMRAVRDSLASILHRGEYIWGERNRFELSLVDNEVDKEVWNVEVWGWQGPNRYYDRGRPPFFQWIRKNTVNGEKIYQIIKNGVNSRVNRVKVPCEDLADLDFSEFMRPSPKLED